MLNQKLGENTPQIIHLFIGFSTIFTIHFGGKPPIFGNTCIIFKSKRLVMKELVFDKGRCLNLQDQRNYKYKLKTLDKETVCLCFFCGKIPQICSILNLMFSEWRKLKWHMPGNSKWPFYSLVEGHLTFPKGHLTIPKKVTKNYQVVAIPCEYLFGVWTIKLGFNTFFFQNEVSDSQKPS